jgi:hypothetical protein
VPIFMFSASIFGVRAAMFFPRRAAFFPGAGCSRAREHSNGARRARRLRPRVVSKDRVARDDRSRCRPDPIAIAVQSPRQSDQDRVRASQALTRLLAQSIVASRPGLAETRAAFSCTRSHSPSRLRRAVRWLGRYREVASVIGGVSARVAGRAARCACRDTFDNET